MLEIDNNITKKNEQFNILIDGYEGPIDLLLDLARKQKVNLSDISILKLAEQYMKDQGRILVRESGTESKIRIMGESENKKLLIKCMNIISKKIKWTLNLKF